MFGRVSRSNTTDEKPILTWPEARLVFNYKKIPYETVWLEHADIEPTLKSMSVHNHRHYSSILTQF
jgi:hypothetical protein